MRPVDRFLVRPWGLYLARPAPDRAQFHYLQSWLLPQVNLRATVFHFNPGYERDQDFYLDIGDYRPGPLRWTSVDHYLDLVLRTGEAATITDVDELLAAVAAGILDFDAAECAIRAAVGAAAGLARHGHDLHRWLATLGMDLTWP